MISISSREVGKNFSQRLKKVPHMPTLGDEKKFHSPFNWALK